MIEIGLNNCKERNGKNKIEKSKKIIWKITKFFFTIFYPSQ